MSILDDHMPIFDETTDRIIYKLENAIKVLPKACFSDTG